MHYHELQQLRRGHRSISEYNEEFKKLAMRAKRYLPTAFQEVQAYISGMWPAEL